MQDDDWMIVTAGNWGRGLNGNYGLRLRRKDRDRFFEKEWESVWLTLRNARGGPDPVEVAITPAFWRKCHELRDRGQNRVIRDWLERHGKLPWEPGKPPRFRMKHTGGNKFEVWLD